MNEQTLLDPINKALAESTDLTISIDDLLETARLLRDQPETRFDVLDCLSAVDWKDKFQIVYHLLSMTHHRRLTMKVDVNRDDPVLPSLVSIWKAANWHEREAYDLFGIIFDGHPDLRRILLPEDWEGYPLRKNADG